MDWDLIIRVLYVPWTFVACAVVYFYGKAAWNGYMRYKEFRPAVLLTAGIAISFLSSAIDKGYWAALRYIRDSHSIEVYNYFESSIFIILIMLLMFLGGLIHLYNHWKVQNKTWRFWLCNLVLLIVTFIGYIIIV